MLPDTCREKMIIVKGYTRDSLTTCFDSSQGLHPPSILDIRRKNFLLMSLNFSLRKHLKGKNWMSAINYEPLLTPPAENICSHTLSDGLMTS